jgi:hypothetical protein
MSYKSPFAEVIHLNNGVIESYECKNKSCLDKLINVAQQNLTSTSVLILDLHNVTDLFDHTEHLSNFDICVLSFVGRSGETRNIARNDIIGRINIGQIKIGIMVFERPKQKNIEKSKNIDDMIGTKAWIINNLNNCLKNKELFFVDDSADHVDLTNKYLGDKKNIHSFLVDGTKNNAKDTIHCINKYVC